ncbi:MAG: hypothetical protein AAF849_20935 [Bacteroidota bacterium]
MKTTHLFFIISLFILGLFACQNQSDQSTTAKKDDATAVTAAEDEKTTDETATTSTTVEKESSIADIQQVLQAISENVEADQVMYDSKNPKNLADCSGIFHRMIDSVQNRFPTLEEDDFPAVNVARGSKQIVKWYHDNGNLTIVDDALAIRNDIRPGTVVFFASKQDPSEKLTIEKLQKSVYHIAVVTSLEKDENGDLISYRMMHGRSKGKLASRTQSASVDDEKGRPPLGNDYSQLVAIADFLPTDIGKVEAIAELEPEEPTAPAVPSTTPTSDPSAERFRAGISDARMSLALESIAINMEAQKLKYDGSIGQDCSGIYHRVKDSLQARFPVLARDFQFPQYNTDRNTRQIAYWYHGNNNLHFVQDALADQNLLRPGSVLFFGRTDEKYSNINIDVLSNADVFQHSGDKGEIYHIAVVTAVRDDDGKKRVTIMHGRNSKHPASRTEVNYDGPGGYKKAFAKFPFGNWNQQLIAIANIATPK